ncbi:acetylcholine receptor subunit alpha-like [Euwallacea similis]|uniref:acetylcholine receptor subunit alpha-like n=1 Tax=Euwallacea similis TaxID=1736056 RepID=UPI00344F4513
MLRAVICATLIATSAYALESESKCPASSGSTAPSRLKTSLLCDYDSLIRPVKDHRNATIVLFKLLLKYLSFDHFNHRLSVDSWFSVFWTDQHLVWTPADYEGIKSIHLSPSYDMWSPDISIYNRHDQSIDPKAISDTMCTVNYMGSVLCVPPLHFDTLCVPNLKKYPYDTQECTVRFGSWVHKGEELSIKPFNPVVDTEDLESDGEWKLVSFRAVVHKGNYTCCPNNTYPSVDVILEIRRSSGTHVFNVVLPLLVCIMLTITTMAMSPLNKDRFILGCVSVVAHIYHVQNLSYMIPVTGEDLPSLLTISRDSTLLSGMSLIFTIILKNLMQSKSQCPNWIAGTASVLIGSRPGQLIFLPDSSFKGAAAAQKQEDGDTIISNIETPTNSSTSDWFVIAKLIDVLLCIIYFLVYAIILLCF